MRRTRTDPRIGLFLVIAGVLAMIFGDPKTRLAGVLLVWFVVFVFIPILCGPFLCRRFGTPLGLTIAFLPGWLPIVLLLVEKL